jgi:MEDS: MEthanogen/methylotroph, DcmR Sensory domain
MENAVEDHLVQFYLSDAYLAGTVSEFLVEGLKAGEACIALSSAEHISMIEKILKTSVDLVALAAQGRWITLEMDNAESWLCVDGRLQAHALRSKIEPLLTAAERTGVRTRIFEEIVAVLAQKCRMDESFELEQIWNSIQGDHDFTLFCSYSREALHRCDAHDYPKRVSSEHSQVVPDETYTEVNDGSKRLRKMAFLELRNAELQAEIAGFPRNVTGKTRRSPKKPA